MEEFKRTGLAMLVDSRLNIRCSSYGYQYSDIMLALFCVYLCGGDHLEDITTILNKCLRTAPMAKIPSSDTIARGLKELRSLSITYTSPTGRVYAHDPACGSFTKELVEELFLRTDTFYLRASSCAERRKMYEECEEWRHTAVNGQDMDVASFAFTDFLSD